MLLGWHKKDQASQVSNVLGVIRKVGIQLKVKVDIKILSIYDAYPIGILFLVTDKQAWTILLPIVALQMNEHLGPSRKQNASIVFIKSSLQLFFKQ